MSNAWTKPWRTRPINPEEFRASQIKRAIANGDLPGTAGGQANHVQELTVTDPPAPPRRRTVNFNSLAPRSRWTKR